MCLYATQWNCVQCKTAGKRPPWSPFHVNPKFESASPQRRANLKQERQAMSAALWKERLILPIVAILLLLGLLAAAWVIANDQKANKGPRVEISEENLKILRDEVEERLKNFEVLAGRKKKLLDEDLKELELAVAAQEKVINAVGLIPADTSRLENLRARLHVYRAERVREASVAAESEAEKAAKEGNLEKAQGFLKQALQYEQEIRDKWVLSNLDDRGRVARLDIRLRRMEALPIWEEGRKLEKQAQEEAVKGNFEQADQLLRQAIALEQVYVMRYRDVRATEHNRIQKLEERAVTLRSQAAKVAVNKMVDEAERAEQAREWERAIKLWGEATAAMKEILTLYQGSVYADDKLPVVYARREALARAMPEVEKFRQSMDSIRELLRSGDVSQAGALASAASAQLQVLMNKFPEAVPAQDTDRRALTVIQERLTSLSVVREAFVNQLVPLPAYPGRKILKTEVTQALYQAVMGSNPSATRDPALPVESIDYGQAEDFARRLGWLTGLNVKLPRPEELNAAHLPERESIPTQEAWTLDNSGGKVRLVATSRPNPAGIYDLSGNVAEWALATDNSPTAPVVGGDAQSVPESKQLGVNLVGRNETSRFRGFRVIVTPN